MFKAVVQLFLSRIYILEKKVGSELIIRMTRKLARHHYQPPIEFFDDIHLCAFPSEFLYSKMGILHSNSDHLQKHLKLGVNDAHNVDS